LNLFLKFKACLAFFLVSIGFTYVENKSDSSLAIFLPQTMRKLADVGQNFSFFWKGIFLIDASKSDEALLFAQKLCENLKKNDSVSDFYCTQKSFKQNPQQLQEWIRDFSLRQQIPSQNDFRKSSQKQIAFASLPGIPTELLTSMRMDPFGTSQELWALKEKTILFNSQLNGYFSNKAHDIIMIPVAFLHSPQEVEKTKTLMSALDAICKQGNCPHYALVGPHSSTYINQSQVMKDLKIVTSLGGLLLLCLTLLLGWKRGAALLSLFVPLLPALAISYLVTHAIFSSVHGLTLAFGPGLVGLVLDYGLNSKIHKSTDIAWTSNFYGLLTTLAGFVVLLFSHIPLIRQLMVFSITGLSLSFAFYYIIAKKNFWIWRATEFKSFTFRMPPSTWVGFSMLFLSLASIFLWRFVGLDLNLRNFEFRQSYQSELEKRWWTSQEAPEILFSADPTLNRSFAKEQKEWAEKSAILLQNIATYLPTTIEQQENLATWNEISCQKTIRFDSTEERFFDPYKNIQVCANDVKTLRNPPFYVSDYISKDWNNPALLSVWFPKTLEQKSLLLVKYPQTTSLRKIFEEFPKTLLKEILLMFPIGYLLCFLLVYYHVRDLFYSFLATLPLFTAVGFVLFVFFLLGKSISFVGFVALLMIFGSSVDYGIFQVDCIRSPQSKDIKERTFSALFMAAVTTLLGYLPLAFAKHPVLNDLGWVLSLGTLGAFLGGVWGIPFFEEKFSKYMRPE